ncbi:MAG: ABC transporter permease [Chloroflexi bacterium]|nr:ABC transporter permease [Chloroflexota bacterium]
MLTGKAKEIDAVPTGFIGWSLKGRRYRKSLWRFLRAKPLGAIGLLVIVLTLMVAAFGNVVRPYDPIQMNFLERLEGPSAKHWFGTDPFGRDVFSSILGGARVSIYVGFASVTLGAGLGGIWGIASGYLGGKFDLVSQRLVDVKQSIPTLALALAVVATFGNSLNMVVLAISLGALGGAVRVVRSQAITVRHTTFIDAARALGSTDLRIILRHVLPNCVAPWIIVFSAGLGGAILAEASLSYLGVGVPPPHPSWGRMLSGLGREYLMAAPWLSFAPGLAIMVVVLAFNLFGDALRDVLDPKLRGSGRR